ncbi:MAG: hypothetical protein WB780_21000, partial [Candidatus Acidiferrales bacterium]
MFRGCKENKSHGGGAGLSSRLPIAAGDAYLCIAFKADGFLDVPFVNPVWMPIANFHAWAAFDK